MAMKKFIISVLAALMIGNANVSADVVKHGNVFIQTTTSASKQKSKPKKTKFTYKDKDGNDHPIYISENGSCFILRKSKKTGKEYKQYLGKDISMQICKELKVTYKGK